MPSSIVTGIETTTAFLHSWSTFTRRWSISKMSATRRSCWRAIWNGFSRRWDSGASTVVTNWMSIGLYLMRNAIVRIVGGALLVGDRDQPHGVAAGVERGARWGRVR